MTSQEARDKRASAWAEMQNLMSEAKDRAMTAEEQQRFDKFEQDIQAHTEEITRLEKFEGRKAEFAEVRNQPTAVETAVAKVEQESDEQRAAKAFSSWLRYGTGGLDAEERSALAGHFVNPKEMRAQGVATSGAGGYLVPAQFRARLIEAQKAFGSVRDAAEVIETDNGASLPWPTVDDTANVGAILAENTQVTEQDVVFGTAALDAYMYTSKLVRVSLQLAQDSGFDLDEWLPRNLGVRIARIQNQHFTTGTGTAQPLGIATSATVGKTGAAGQVTTVTYDDLVDLVESVDPAYRAQGRFMARSFAAVRKLKDTTGQPLWQPGMQAGEPDRLLNYPLIVNPDMPAMAASARSILFGDFRAGYVVRDVTDVQQLRLEERYADFLQVGFLAFQRAGGTVQNAAAYKAYQHPAA